MNNIINNSNNDNIISYLFMVFSIFAIIACLSIYNCCSNYIDYEYLKNNDYRTIFRDKRIADKY